MSTKMTNRQADIIPEKLAEWWVLLNCWEWPNDLPGKPQPPGGMTADQFKYATRGAFAIIDLLADAELVGEVWQDETRRRALIEENRAAGARSTP